jgi:hypothetical protein
MPWSKRRSSRRRLTEQFALPAGFIAFLGYVLNVTWEPMAF